MHRIRKGTHPLPVVQIESSGLHPTYSIMPYSNISKRAQSPFDFVDFGDIVPHNGLLVDEGLHDPLFGSVEFDVEELIDILEAAKVTASWSKCLVLLG